jgi:ankyrin repeat protein
MSEHLAANLRYQPARLCKKGNGRSFGSVQQSNLNRIEKDVDRQDHGGQANSTHTCSQTWDREEMNQLFSEKLASLTLQGSGAIIQLFDACDPAHLFSAIRWGETRAVKEWCKCNAIDVNTTDAMGHTVLHLGAEQGELGLFHFLLRWSGIGIDAVDTSGKTALFYAAQRERAALVKRLLCSYGAAVDIRDNSGRTPLSHAAECNSYRSIELLLEAGADDTSEDDSGRTPWFYAVRAGNCAATVRLVRHTKDGNQALVLAAQMEKANIENKLMTMGKDVANWDDGKLQKLLLQSAHNGRDDMVRMLLHLHQVETDTRDGKGRTPLSLAAERGHRNIIRILLRRGANRDLRDKKSRSPVDYAVQHGTSTYQCIVKSRVQRSRDSCYLLRASEREHQHRARRNDRDARRVRKS